MTDDQSTHSDRVALERQLHAFRAQVAREGVAAEIPPDAPLAEQYAMLQDAVLAQLARCRERMDASRRAEEAVRRSQTLLAEAERLSHTGAWEWDLTTDQWTFSDEWLAIHGIAHRTLSPGELLTIAYPEDRAAVSRAFDEVRTGAKPYAIEHRIIRQDTGKVRVVRAYGQFERDETGAVVRVYGFAQDITEQKRTEEALRESEERYRSSVVASAQVVWTTNERGEVDMDIPSWQAFTGQSAEEARGYGWMNAIHPEDRERVAEAWRKASESHTIYEVEYLLRAYDGSWRHILARGVPVFNDDGTVREYVGTCIDITEQKRTEEALRASEARWTAAIETFNIGAIIATEDEQVIYWNPAARKMHGFTYEGEGIEPLERTPVTFQLWTPDKRHLLELDEWPMRRIKRGEPVKDLELWLRRPDQGWEKYVSYSGNMVETPSGERLIFLSVYDLTRQREAEEALRASEQRLRLALDAAHLIAWEYDPATERVTMTENAPEVLALPSGKVHETSEQGYAIIHPEDVEQHRVLVSETVTHAGSYISVYRQIKDDGEVIWLEERARAVTDASGKTVRLVGVTQNITARKQAEEALRESEAKFRSIFEQAGVGMGRVRFDDARWIDVNEAFTHMLGYSREEMLSTPWPGITSPDDIDIDLIPFRQMAAGELDSYSVEKRFIHKQGHLVWARLTLSLVRDAHGQPAYEVAIIEDITERKRAEEALRESEARFSAMANNISQLAWMTDETGWIFWYNQRWYDYTGTTLEEMQGWGWQKVHHPDYVQGVTDKFKHAIETGGPWEDTFPLRGKDGQYRWFLSRAVPIRDETGKVVRWFGTNTDITELRDTQLELQQLTATLEQRVKERTAALETANRELEAFSYSVSHDLRAPLRSIDGFSKILLDKYAAQIDPTGQDYLTRVRNAAVRMGRLIDDMLNLSRIGRREMTRTSVDLSDLAASVIADLRQRDPERAVLTEVQAGLQVTGDAGLLRIVFENLLGNAWKFTSKREDARIEVGAMTQDGEHVYYVRDNGAGFDMSYADKLFTPFQRLHTEEEFPGTGIGLAIVQRIVARHGGRVWAEGEAGKGATIYFTLGETTP